jgi:F-type H+-transporting ATPase subunit epsilon
VQYSNIAAKVVRKSLKPQLQAEADKRSIVSVKFTKWESGKPVGEPPPTQGPNGPPGVDFVNIHLWRYLGEKIIQIIYISLT